MVLDSCNRLNLYYSLDDKLRNLDSIESQEVPEFNSFKVERNATSLFTVNKGSATFATSWRENPDSRDTTAAVMAKEGEFVLFLPGEPFIVKVGEGSEVSLFVLGE